MKTFEELGISNEILNSLKEMNFSEPTIIQERTIPDILVGKDVIAGSQTGSGKTLAFGSGIIENCSRKREIQSLILTPTRELCEQIMIELKKFSKYKPLKITSVYGGVAIGPQISNLKDSDVVVATPGRLLDHIERNTINLSKITILVLDEADRMVDMGFIDDIKRIIEYCPEKRQTLLFSATISKDIKKISQKYMNEPLEIIETAQIDPQKLNQVYYRISSKQKLQLLIHLLKNETSELSMIFCNTQRTTSFVTSNLLRNNVNATEIHGGFTQAKRNNTMQLFHQKKVSVLVCTDVASRGLDIKNVSHVYNFDTPKDTKTYIHRIGRTARAGAEGIAINLIAEKDYEFFSDIVNEYKLRPMERRIPLMDRYIISKEIINNELVKKHSSNNFRDSKTRNNKQHTYNKNNSKDENKHRFRNEKSDEKRTFNHHKSSNQTKRFNEKSRD